MVLTLHIRLLDAFQCSTCSHGINRWQFSNNNNNSNHNKCHWQSKRQRSLLLHHTHTHTVADRRIASDLYYDFIINALWLKLAQSSSIVFGFGMLSAHHHTHRHHMFIGVCVCVFALIGIALLSISLCISIRHLLTLLSMMNYSYTRLNE